MGQMIKVYRRVLIWFLIHFSDKQKIHLGNRTRAYLTMQAPISAFGILVEGWKRPDEVVELKVRVSEVETAPNKSFF